MTFKRYNGTVEPFAKDATGTNRTVFGDTIQSNDIDDNLNPSFKKGWEIVGINDNPTKQDFNGLAYTVSNLVAYLYQQGISEYNSAQKYVVNSIVIASDGKLYMSLTGDETTPNVGNNPLTDTVNWKNLSEGDNTQRFKVADAVNDDEALSKGQLLTEINALGGLDADLLDGMSSERFMQISALKHTNGGDEHLFIPRPGGGEYSEDTSSNVGAIQIALPVLWTSTMLMFYVDIYDYSSQTTMTFQIGGYNSSYGNNWQAVNAMQIGGTVKYNVRFGSDGTKTCIQIGELDDTGLDTIKVTIRDFTASHNGATKENWEDGWEITRTQTALTQLDHTINSNAWSNLNDGAGSGLDADKVDGLHANELALLNGNNTQRFKVADAVNDDEAISKGQLLAEIKTVDGHGSGLDADKVDGVQGALLGIGGAGYSWVNQTASRVLDTVYVNMTGSPMQVSVSVIGDAGDRLWVDVFINNLNLGHAIGENADGPRTEAQLISFIVPNGNTYELRNIYQTTIYKWFELTR